MTLDAIIAAAARRAKIYDPPSCDAEEEDDHKPAQPSFSIRAIVDEHGEDYVRQGVRLSWDEFRELFQIVEHSMSQRDR
jgi:hypothetical protein